MNNLFIIILFVVVTIIYVQFLFINKKMTKYEIIQANNPDKDSFENLLKKKQVSVFTNILKTTNIDINSSNTEELKNTFYEHFKYYHIPLTFTYKFKLENEAKDSYKPIIRVTSYRFINVIVKGTKKIVIFNTQQEPNLYITNGISSLDFWNVDKQAYPKYLNLKYIEIILKENNMIYIPFGWWYSEYNLEDTVSISSFSESVFSFCLKNNI